MPNPTATIRIAVDNAQALAGLRGTAQVLTRDLVAASQKATGAFRGLESAASSGVSSFQRMSSALQEASGKFSGLNQASNQLLLMGGAASALIGSSIKVAAHMETMRVALR